MTQCNLNSYLGLPSLGGASSVEDACRLGYSVEDNVLLLKRYHHSLKRIWKLLVGRIPCEPIYELKMGFSYHANLFAEDITSLRTRVGEMREPPLGLDQSPDPALDLLFDEIRNSEDTLEFLTGIYRVALPDLACALETHLRETNGMSDQPSVRVLKFILLDLQEALAWGKAACERLEQAWSKKAAAAEWARDFGRYLAAAGGLNGRQPRSAEAPEPNRSKRPYRYDSEPHRDERFTDPFNMAVNTNSLMEKPYCTAHARGVALLVSRIREIDVPEWMSSIIMETENKPWEYYADMTRQLWDEARHGMLGEVACRQQGIDWTLSRVRHAWSYGMNKNLTAKERHAILWDIEQSLMGKTGKVREWEYAKASGNPLLMTFHDYDWADEVLHAQIGRKWLVSEFESTAAARGYAAVAWEKESSRREDYAALGLTGDENWWPEFYLHACAATGVQADPQIAAFNEHEPRNSEEGAIAAG